MEAELTMELPGLRLLLASWVSAQMRKEGHGKQQLR